MKGLNSLNEPQRAAVRQIHGPVLILAGAGTGKTRVITMRIAYMVSEDIRPQNILAVTFTNKAAAEMRERVAGLISKDDAKAVTVSTFHSLCVRILRRNIDRLGYKRNFGIYSGADQMGLVRKIIGRKGGKETGLDANVALSLIGKWKNSGTPVSNNAQDLIVEVARCYQEELKTLNSVDFDDLLILAVELLENDKDVREYWQKQFPYIMVDEFQDTNNLQMRLLRNLAGKRHNVCVVGDDDQSIYGWRGADISNILEFERFFPNPKVIKLEENYRCTQPVLQLANSIIRKNKNRREKTLWCKKESHDLVRLIAMPGAEEEAEIIVNEIYSQAKTQNREWEDFAILFRTNAQSRLLEHALRSEEIPYRVVGGMSFFDRREVRDIVSYLMVLANPKDDVNLLRVINNPPRGIGDSAIKAATEFSMKQNLSVWESLQHPDYLSERTSRSRNGIAGFVALMNEFGAVARTPSADYATMTGDLLKEIEFFDYLRRTCKNEEEANKRENNAREFIDTMYDHRARSSKKSKGLQHFLDEITLMSDRDDDDISNKKGVCLITLHAAKGLEFPVVYLVGLEEGIIPHMRSVDEGTKDEERRLLYVGITRAQEHLSITYCATRKKYGEQVPCLPRSFIKEFDEEYLEMINYDQLAEEPATEEVAAGYFEKMREMLATGNEA
ncbi:MAG: UvrD-helicase domain-containing protein [Verrucomicrobiota bacterium]